MSQFYGYRCYASDNIPIGWLYTIDSGRSYLWTDRPAELKWCKQWKTIKGAERTFEHFDRGWNLQSNGGYLKIEIMPDFEIPLSQSAQSRKRWDTANPEIIKHSKAKYDKKRPVVGFRPTPEIRAWLDEERWEDNGIPETDAALVNRKLEKLRKLECQGY